MSARDMRMEEWRHCMADMLYTPLELSDGKPEPSERLLLAASAIVMGDLDPNFLIIDWTHYTFDRTIATARRAPSQSGNR